MAYGQNYRTMNLCPVGKHHPLADTFLFSGDDERIHTAAEPHLPSATAYLLADIFNDGG